MNWRSTVRRAIKRPSAGAHMAIGARRPHAGEFTVHPNVAVTIAITVVVPMAIDPKTNTARHGMLPRPVVVGVALPIAGAAPVPVMMFAGQATRTCRRENWRPIRPPTHPHSHDHGSVKSGDTSTLQADGTWRSAL